MVAHKNLTVCVLGSILSYYIAHAELRSLQKSVLVDHCDKLYSLACFKIDAANWLDKFGINKEFNVIPGVTFMQSPNSVEVYTSDIAAEVAREFPNDVKARADRFLAKKLESFLDSHYIKLNLWKAIQGQSESSGRKDKGKKGDSQAMSMIIIAGGMVIGVLTALAMGGITALAGKALITGMISFVISTIIGLKQLTSAKENGYVSQPVPIHTVAAHDGWENYAGHSRRSYEIIQPQSSDQARNSSTT